MNTGPGNPQEEIDEFRKIMAMTVRGAECDLFLNQISNAISYHHYICPEVHSFGYIDC